MAQYLQNAKLRLRGRREVTRRAQVAQQRVCFGELPQFARALNVGPIKRLTYRKPGTAHDAQLPETGPLQPKGIAEIPMSVKPRPSALYTSNAFHGVCSKGTNPARLTKALFHLVAHCVVVTP